MLAESIDKHVGVSEANLPSPTMRIVKRGNSGHRVFLFITKRASTAKELRSCSYVCDFAL